MVTAPVTWLQRAPSPAAVARVFCIPHAGCGTNVFGRWPHERDGVEFLPVELPGRLTRFGERMPETFQALAAAMTDGLRSYLDIPFAFFGHCWSALAAYEITAQLDTAGPRPTRLFVSSQVAPQDGPVGRMLEMDEPELRVELEATIRNLGGKPHPELVGIYLGVLRDDIAVSRRYVLPHPRRLSCPLTAIGWSEDDEVSPGQMAGWSACGEATFPRFPGRHHRFADAPSELLDLLTTQMSRP